MASCSGNGSRGHHRFTLNVSETYVSDSGNNYSDVIWELVLSPIQNGWDWYYGSTAPVSWSVNIGGNSYNGNIMNYNGSSTVTVGSGSTRIYHNDDGSKSINFSFSVWDNISANYLPGSASGSGSMPLTNIPRASEIGCSSPYIGDTATITISKKSSSLTSTIWYVFGNVTNTIATKTYDTVLSFNTNSVKSQLYAQIPNATQGYGTMYCETFSGNISVGVKSCQFYLYAKESDCRPTFSTIFKDIKPATIEQTGDDNIIVKGASNLQATINATAKYSSSISSYSVVCDDGQKDNSQVSVIYRPKSSIIKVAVKDSRGYSTTTQYNLSQLNQWLNYIELAYTSDISVKRSEQLSDEVVLNVKGNFFNGKLGTTAGLRNVRVGDDLSGKTIYFDFWDRIHYLMKHYDEDNKDIIVADKKITQELFENQSGNDEGIIKADSTILYDAEYVNDPSASYVNTFISLDHITLPNDFGVVTSINSDLMTYTDIYILSDDTPVDNNNSLSMYFQYKLSGTYNWSNQIAITPTISGNYFYVNDLVLGNYFDHNQEYVFRVIAQDKLMIIGNYDEQVVTKATPIVRIGEEFVQVNGELLINSGEAFGGYILYDNPSGETGDITLNDFVSNYEYLEIIFKDNVEAIGSVKMIPSYSTKCNLTVVAIDDSNIQYIKNRQLNVSGNQITNYQSLHEGSMGNDGSQSVYTLTTAIKILKVIGYK